MNPFIQLAYFIAAVLFIVGLKRMSSPRTARLGIVWAGAGMSLAVLATFFYSGLSNYFLMILAIAVAGAGAWWWARHVAMTDMPQMIAIYNGMGGGSAAAIAAVELVRDEPLAPIALTLAVLGALVGSIALSGSAVAFAKLQGLMDRTIYFPKQQVVNLSVFAAAVILGIMVIADDAPGWILFLFFVLALVFGVLMTLPIGGADMPVVISLYNALTGLAVGFEGFVLANPAMMIAGIVVGAAGTLLTQLMAKAMNRSLAKVLFSQFGAKPGEALGPIEGSLKPVEANDAASLIAYANKVIVVPGYGLAVAQAQHKLWEFCRLLQERGVDVKFAIHPVAGRMPGHMNVLLAEAGVPYDMIYDLDEINEEFATADVALIIGANDVVNPSARTDSSSPIYGMPILNADQAENVIVIKRGKGAGFSGVENHLFYAENTRMLYGDGQKMASALITAAKAA
ncbi:MAG: NAD(P)(+) transhydrogenase (Re/Si-specific) subunit beta [Pseudomonadota bacterium]|nr:NAD(P)(+) transhydrogenase (Re/Si-specific) subunit beta [Pseudomonadota bacterium]